VSSFDAVDQPKQRGNHDSRLDERQHDVEEELQRPGAVNPRGLDGLVRHDLQRCEDDEHRKGKPLPSFGERDRPQRGVRIGYKRWDQQGDGGQRPV